MLHVDETSDRIGTTNCWMHVVSTSLYTLIHASATRGEAAIDEAGVLKGYTGVLVHDRLAMYFKLKRAKHGLCGADNATRGIMRQGVRSVWLRLVVPGLVSPAALLRSA